ncbi:MAG: formate/nitrite transporter family protein [Novosphingobium sp.]|nr:formate/nitrite transporter family protein [Novosphingobium sp.]
MADHTENLDEKQRSEVEELQSPEPKVVHAAVSEEGEDELNRPLGSLFWSAVAAGVSIMASLSVSGALHHYAPPAPWREAIVALGYPVGFLIVILGRMQLFTEQTVVAILPLARETTSRNFGRVARLWSIVALGNVVGSAAVAALASFGHVQPREVLEGMTAVAATLQERTWGETLMQAIPAGFIMAAVAWIRSAASDRGFAVVLVLTYAIGLCGFAHVVAGAAEAWLLCWTGAASLGWVLGGFVAPALIGNIVGGTGLFAVLAHAQVRQEI